MSSIFNKLFYTANELMEILSIPESTFYKFQNEWIKEGGDIIDMGKVEIEGGPKLWNGSKFLEWLINNRTKQSEKILLFIKQNKREDVN